MKKIPVIAEIIAERARQDDKWGEQNHAPSDWLTILMEEVGEAAKAALETKFDFRNDGYVDYRREMLQVAAVAVAAIESYDRGKWEDKL